ncbi:MAG: hypothetical protein WC867_01170 [Candidatus Pacearchaeota archaeon]|jgi:plastocyanin
MKKSPLSQLSWILISLSVLVLLLVFFISIFLYTRPPEEIITNKNNNEIPELKTHIIKITKVGFVPNEVESRIGDSVIWINEEYVFYKVISDDKVEFQSSRLYKGQNYTYVTLKEGTYDYHCSDQPYLKGKIIVK